MAHISANPHEIPLPLQRLLSPAPPPPTTPSPYPAVQPGAQPAHFINLIKNYVELPDRDRARRPLHYSAVFGVKENVKFLTALPPNGAGAAMTVRDNEGMTPLELAMVEGQLELVPTASLYIK